jgi:hypothetical protein
VVRYEVTATIRPDLAAAYERYLRETHIPELLATGCFTAATMGMARPGHYRIWYDAPDLAALDRYLGAHAARLRADVRTRFPDGLALEREQWMLLEQWPAP